MITALEQTEIRVVQKGDRYTLGGYEFEFVDAVRADGPNYAAQQGIVNVRRDGAMVATLHPEKRVYTVQRMPTTEAAIDMGLTRDVYVVLGDPQEGGGWAMRTYIKPFANWIWIGSIVMALGGVISLTDRRYRVAAVARDRRRMVAAE